MSSAKRRAFQTRLIQISVVGIVGLIGLIVWTETSRNLEGGGAQVDGPGLFATDVVPARFREFKDAFDGDTKAIGYVLDSDADDARLVLSCENGHLHSDFGFRAVGTWPATLNVDVKMKVDDGPTQMAQFTTQEGQSGISPGSGTKEDAVAFMKRLRGKSHLVIQASLSGIQSADLPSTFNIDGIEGPINRVLRACNS